MTDIRQRVTNDIANQNAEELESLIRQSIMKRLGCVPPMWSMEGRLSRKRVMNGGQVKYDVYEMDNEPLIYIYPTTSETVEEDGKIIMKFNTPHVFA